MPNTSGGNFPYAPGAISYLMNASRIRDRNTRPRVKYFQIDETTRVVDTMTREVINEAQTFLTPIDVPAIVEVKTPGGTFVTPEGPFRKENRITFTVGRQTLEELNLDPDPRDEFELDSIRYRIKAFDRLKFMQNNAASIDLRYECEFVERYENDLNLVVPAPQFPGGANADLPPLPTVEVAEDE